MDCVSKLVAAASWVGNVLLPPLCRHCGDLADGDTWGPLLCGRCDAEFPVFDGPVAIGGEISRAHAFALFEGPARRLLIDLKYGGVVRAGTMLGVSMAAAVDAAPILADAELVVPVPLHWRRRWRRGHNQAAVIARALTRKRPDLAMSNAMRRVRATPPQVGLARQQRLANVRAAFRVKARCRGQVKQRTVVMVDDVVTTGTTATAAAIALREAGARRVHLYAAAFASI